MQLWGNMEDEFQDILNKVTKKPGRSRLEQYGELIDELRGRGLTYRDISDILTAELQFQVSEKHSQRFRAKAIPTEAKCRPQSFTHRRETCPDGSQACDRPTEPGTQRR